MAKRVVVVAVTRAVRGGSSLCAWRDVILFFLFSRNSFFGEKLATARRNRKSKWPETKVVAFQFRGRGLLWFVSSTYWLLEFQRKKSPKIKSHWVAEKRNETLPRVTRIWPTLITAAVIHAKKPCCSSGWDNMLFCWLCGIRSEFCITFSQKVKLVVRAFWVEIASCCWKRWFVLNFGVDATWEKAGNVIYNTDRTSCSQPVVVVVVLRGWSSRTTSGKNPKFVAIRPHYWFGRAENKHATERKTPFCLGLKIELK